MKFDMNLDEAVEMFIQTYLNNSIVKNRQPLMTDLFLNPNHPLTYGRLPRSRFYCGITNDIDRRMSEHNATAFIWVTSKDVDAAISLESKLGEQGFDIGSNPGNGASDDSIYVYMYKKIPGITNE